MILLSDYELKRSISFLEHLFEIGKSCLVCEYRGNLSFLYEVLEVVIGKFLVERNCYAYAGYDCVPCCAPGVVCFADDSDSLALKAVLDKSGSEAVYIPVEFIICDGLVCALLELCVESDVVTIQIMCAFEHLLKVYDSSLRLACSTRIIVFVFNKGIGPVPCLIKHCLIFFLRYLIHLVFSFLLPSSTSQQSSNTSESLVNALIIV